MFCSVYSADVFGIEARKVCVEADISGGLPEFTMVGMLSNEVKEAKNRVMRAICNSGYEFPSRKITINISPANIRKNGTGFDLPIAIAILTALGHIKREALEGKMFVGELSLDGTINPVRGILSISTLARGEGIKNLIVPEMNKFEGSVIPDVNISGAKDIISLVMALNHNELEFVPHQDLEKKLEESYYENKVDYSDIKGQDKAKRAIMIAVAGFHNLLFCGPPGSGKTMLSKRISTIQNRMSVEECLEISKIYSVAGLLKNESLVLNRPFRNPHHSISEAAFAGGSIVPKPGEISLAHNGVLFLDEAAEFKKSTIELLRQPMEDKQISVNRISGEAVFPSDFMLVMAMNPCKCGYYPDRNLCRCTETDVRKYLGKIRGPVLDRIDICVGTTRLEVNELSNNSKSPGSDEMRNLVSKAKEIQEERFQKEKIVFNSQMSKREIEKYCILDGATRELLNKAYANLNLSVRGYYKILKVARTIADVEGKINIEKSHVLEAISYRNNLFDM